MFQANYTHPGYWLMPKKSKIKKKIYCPQNKQMKKHVLDSRLSRTDFEIIYLIWSIHIKVLH